MRGTRRTWPTAMRASPARSACARVPRAAARRTSCPGWSRRTSLPFRFSRSTPTSRSSSRGKFTLTELDQRTLMKPLTKWNAVIDRSAEIPKVLRKAFEAMTSGRPGAAHVALPFDVQNGPVDRNDVWADPTLGAFPSRRVAPDPSLIEVAAKLLRKAKQPLFICGGGVVLSGAEAELLARRKARRSGGDDDQRQRVDRRARRAGGRCGRLERRHGGDPCDRRRRGPHRVRRLPRGLGDDRALAHPAPGSARIIHIDVDPAVRAPTTRSMCRSSATRLCLAALDEALDGTKREGDFGAVEARKREKFAKFEALARSDDSPIKPERVVYEMQKAAGPGCDRGRRSRHAVPLLLRLLRGRRHRPAVLLQPRARRARLFARRQHRRALRQAEGEDRRRHGRRQLRHVRGRARDRGAPQVADNVRRDLERGLRLDQGRAEIGL